MNRFALLIALGCAGVYSHNFTGSIAWADNIFVANGINSTIVEFDSSGNETTFATNGLSAPQGMVFDTSGNLYVANSGNATIEEFNPSGNGTIFAQNQLRSSLLHVPLGLAFDLNQNLYVANLGSVGNTSVDKFNTNGVGSVFVNAHSIDSASGIAIDKSNTVYVTDFSGNFIAIYDTDGNETGIITNFGTSLSEPTGLAFDSAGNLYVANYGGNTIEKFSANGIATVFADSGLDEPADLAFDSSGNLYAVNYGDNTVEKFDTNGVGTVFAAGLSGPEGIAIEVPEPSSLLLAGTGLLFLATAVKRRHRRLAVTSNPLDFT